MSTFPFDQNNGAIDDVPEQWRALDDQKVILYGEMWNDIAPATSSTASSSCYSIAKCCLSGPPQIQHFVHSKVVDDKQGRLLLRPGESHAAR